MFFPVICIDIYICSFFSDKVFKGKGHHFKILLNRLKPENKKDVIQESIIKTNPLQHVSSLYERIFLK